MMNKFHLALHLRTDGIKDKSFPYIYVTVILNGTRVNLGSTGIRVRKEDWDIKSRRSTRKDVQSQADNATLDSVESRLRSIHLLYESRQKRLYPEEIKKLYKQNYDVDLSFFTLRDKYFEESQQMMHQGQVAKKTHSTRKDKLKVFERYLDAEKKTQLTMEEIKGAIFERFKSWMLRQGYKLTYAQKCQQFLKTFVLWCFRHGYIDFDPSANYPVKVDKKPILEHLSEEELQRLKSEPFVKRLQETVDCYLFACDTGLAYVDMSLLSAKSLVEENGLLYVSGARQKTDASYFVPLSKSAKAIVDKYGGIDKLPLRSNKEVNAMLKVAMAQIKVDRRIWFHTARKTFAHRMQNVLCLSDEATAAMIGHKSTKELKSYRNITKERVMREMPRFDF
ncbi:phage integrase SAM-like domain-containing protein [Siphonobacter sp. SORGH_AS_0500]|uniref:phage integrase SAM-like domain-containing protein n=1 Tax=Siphonobacter sp. SORGH_AS_0500 TaxID=1864824 RepID=UPI00286564EC|nr:phage integrase SAM-like domain-containing protein [Siphonobacter sp. SORGH_AS_0500]MDR6194915.1 site-specific recombinase XerD [Siphonobacter sp. SORGH_AS_0500]